MAQLGMAIVNLIEGKLQEFKIQSYNEMYIGITNNIRRRLFDEHKVSEETGTWIWDEAVNIEQARAVEKHFLGKGMKGGDGGGDETSVYVYCYKITSSTEE